MSSLTFREALLQHLSAQKAKKKKKKQTLARNLLNEPRVKVHVLMVNEREARLPACAPVRTLHT